MRVGAHDLAERVSRYLLATDSYVWAVFYGARRCSLRLQGATWFDKRARRTVR